VVSGGALSGVVEGGICAELRVVTSVAPAQAAPAAVDG
jgi:hypothetical protein